MKIPTLPFTVTDWSRISPTAHPGETGEAICRTFTIGDLRVRWSNIASAIWRITGATSANCCTSLTENSMPNFVMAEHSSCGLG
jgi:hypothetical protein